MPKLGRRAATTDAPDPVNTELLRKRYRHAQAKVEEAQARVVRAAKVFNKWWKKARYYESRLDKLPLHEAAVLRKK